MRGVNNRAGNSRLHLPLGVTGIVQPNQLAGKYNHVFYSKTFKSMHFFLFFNLFLSMIFFWDDTSKIIDSFEKNRSVERMPGSRFVNDPAGSLLQNKLSAGNPFAKPNQTVQIRFSILFFFISFILLTSDLISRWVFSKHIPLSNLYESLLFLNFNFIGIYFFFIRFEFNQFYVQPCKEKIRYWLTGYFGFTPVTGSSGGSIRLPGASPLGLPAPAAYKRASNPVRNTDPVASQTPTGGEISLLGYRSEGTSCFANNIPNPDFGTPVARAFASQQAEQSGAQTPNESCFANPKPMNQPAKPANTHEFMSHEAVLLGPLLSSTVLFIQCFADWRLPDQMKQIQPLTPALQSNWLLMHVSIMIISYAALFLGSILAITYLGIHWSPDGLEWLNQTNKEPGGSDQANQFFLQLDSLSYRILAFGFPLLTLGILSGAIWANEAWGSYWSWDPKETWAFITWLVFAFYLHTRLQYNWQGIKSAYVATGGFFIVWICYLGVNLLGQGLHSYGWINN